MKNNSGFTVLEMLIVLAIITILIAIAIFSFDRGRSQTNDRVAVSDLRSAQLALEEYRAQCQVYPKDDAGRISLDAQNNFPGSAANQCSLALKHVWPPKVDYEQFEYVALYNSSGSGHQDACSGYHINVAISPENEGLLDEDDDYTGAMGWESCGGFGADHVDSLDPDGFYDVVVGPPNTP
jgi:prepilin-type N-terminal cleavage/methylation domain-containing protein